MLNILFEKRVTRIFFVITIVIGLLLLIRIAPKISASCLLIIFTYAGIRSFLYACKSTKWLSKWQFIRVTKVIRKSFLASPQATTLYFACFALSNVAAFILIAFSSMALSGLFIFSTGIVLVAATVIDWRARLCYFLSFESIRNFSRLVIGFFATCSIFLSIVLANKMTHDIAHVDPSSMPNFIRLMSAFFFPFALSASIAMGLAFVAFTQYMFLLFGVLMSIPARYTLNFFSSNVRQKTGIILYRLIHGRRPPKNRTWWIAIVDGGQFILRPVGTAIIALLVISLGQVFVKATESVPQKYLQILLVNTEYHQMHLCENVPAERPVAYLQGGYVSVATISDDHYSFSTMKCHK